MSKNFMLIPYYEIVNTKMSWIKRMIYRYKLKSELRQREEFLEEWNRQEDLYQTTGRSGIIVGMSLYDTIKRVKEIKNHLNHIQL